MDERERPLHLQGLIPSGLDSMRMTATFLKVQLVGTIGLLMEADIPVQATTASEVAHQGGAELSHPEEAVMDVVRSEVKAPSDTKN